MIIAIWAYLDNNLGDDMMVKLMAGRFPEHSFILYTDASIIKETFKDSKNITVKPTREVNKDLSDIGAYIVLGGSVFLITNIRQQISRLRGLLRFSKLKKNKVIIATLGSNLGPYSNKFGIKLTEWQLRYCDLVTVRDRDSYDLIKTFNKVKNFHLADDIVYNYSNVLGSRTAKCGLGISVYRSLRTGENNQNNYYALAQIADKYIERTGKKVSLFAFDSENENDLSAAHHIFNLAGKKENIEIVPYIGNQDEFLDKFQNCERMIAIRFHSAILSDIFNIPFLPIVYSNKMQNLLDDRGFDGVIIKIEDLNMKLDLESVVDNIISGKKLFKKFIQNKGNSNIHFDELEKIINKSISN